MPNYVHPAQDPQEMASLFIEAADLRDRLAEAAVATDIRLGVDDVVRRGLFGRKKQRIERSLDAWDIPQATGANTDEMALAVDGQVYLYVSGFWSVVSGERLMSANVMNEFHLENFITVDEARARLGRLKSAHL